MWIMFTEAYGILKGIERGVLVKAEKLSREDYELRAFLAREPLENYEWPWVLKAA